MRWEDVLDDDKKDKWVYCAYAANGKQSDTYDPGWAGGGKKVC